MKNVRPAYDYWVRHVHRILTDYRVQPKYELFKETVREVFARSEEKCSDQLTYQRLKKLLTCCQMVMHNRLRRQKTDLMTANSVPPDKLIFKTLAEPERPRYVVDENRIYGQVSKYLDKFPTENDVQRFTDVRTIIAAYAVGGGYKSISVLSDVLRILHFFQKAIEDRLNRRYTDVAENVDGTSNEWLAQSITVAILNKYNEPWEGFAKPPRKKTEGAK